MPDDMTSERLRDLKDEVKALAGEVRELSVKAEKLIAQREADREPGALRGLLEPRTLVLLLAAAAAAAGGSGAKDMLAVARAFPDVMPAEHEHPEAADALPEEEPMPEAP